MPLRKFIDTADAVGPCLRVLGFTRARLVVVPPRPGRRASAAPRAVLALVRGGHHLQARNRCSNPPRN